jgi:hypothetical protein
LGFALLGVSDRPACRGLRRDSSFVLNGSADGGHPSRMHLRVSITERLPRPVAGSGPLLGFSHLSVSRCSNQRQPGLCVHLTGRPPLQVARAGSLGCRDSTGATWRKPAASSDTRPVSATHVFRVLPVTAKPSGCPFARFKADFGDEVSFRPCCSFPEG